MVMTISGIPTVIVVSHFAEAIRTATLAPIVPIIVHHNGSRAHIHAQIGIDKIPKNGDFFIFKILSFPFLINTV